MRRSGSFLTPLLQADARAIFAAGVDAVSPRTMVENVLRFDKSQSTLHIGQAQHRIDSNVRLVAFGKAVSGMIRSTQEILGDNIKIAIGSIPFGLQRELTEKNKLDLLPIPKNNLVLLEGARDNLPDADSQNAAKRILDVALSSGENDILLTLISGGGSALLSLPPPEISLETKVDTIRIVAKAGASIGQLNRIRKELSIVKGGRLAEAAYPAKVVSLILSDVIGDPLDIIASGPTYPMKDDASGPEECLDIINRLEVMSLVPPTVLQYLKSQVGKPRLVRSVNVENHVIGSNRIAVDACVVKAKELGYHPVVLSTEVTGEAADVGRDFALLASYILRNRYPTKNLETVFSRIRFPVCVIAGGETTVQVKGDGIGGRNQELALSASIHMKTALSKEERERCLLLSGGTDGQDGPTSAAGALGCSDVVERAEDMRLSCADYLKKNDSHTLYKKLCNGDFLLDTGLTGTNVMDVQVLLIK